MGFYIVDSVVHGVIEPEDVRVAAERVPVEPLHLVFPQRHDHLLVSARFLHQPLEAL